MKIARILATALAATSLLALTPACQMQSAETMEVTIHSHSEEEHGPESAEKPEPSNPEPPKYFSQ